MCVCILSLLRAPSVINMSDVISRSATVTHPDDATLKYIEPKLAPLRSALAAFVSENAYASQVAEKTKFDVETHLSSYNLNLISIGLEIVGSLLFLSGSKHGARLLLLHLMAVTPIMHNFYSLAPGTNP